MQSGEIRQKFLKFFEKNGHVAVPSSSLVPSNDPSVLFTTAGMQQFKPYYLGEPSPQGNNLTSSQKCVRTSDIEEVGDMTHLTFFEMLGNFSFGGYWKKEAIELAHTFITQELGLKIDYVSVFKDDESGIPADEESRTIWQSVDPTLNIKDHKKEDNFWGPTGTEGPCGPTTEIYINGVEIWNIVFNEYYKDKEGQFKKLTQTGIDTGMGLERLVIMMQGKETIYETDLFTPLLAPLQSTDGDMRSKRIITDHIRTGVFMISDGVIPSNTDRGYILRRLLRRAYVHARKLGVDTETINTVASLVMNHESYRGLYAFGENVQKVMMDEIEKFKKALDAGLKQVEKGEDPFVLFTSYGLPLEIIEEVTAVDKEKFEKQMLEHKALSSSAGKQKFKN